MRLNVAFVLPYIPKIPSGGVIVVLQYAEELVRQGMKVTIYYKTDMVLANKKIRFPKYIREIIGNIESHYYPQWYRLDNRIKIAALFDIEHIETHDVIIATGIETASLVAYSMKKCQKAYYFIQGFENWTVGDSEVIKSYKLGMTNIVISKWLYDIVYRETGIRPIYIPDGINTSIFNCVQPITQRKPHSIVFQYRSEKLKGCMYSLEVVKQLKLVYPDLSVTIISKEKRNEQIPEWCEYIENASLEKVSKINNRSQVFLCSTINEGFGLPGLEAMACGCALVSTSYLGVLEYAVDNQNSLLSPVCDVCGLRRNIEKVFEDELLRYRIVSEGLKTAASFSYLTSAKKFVSLIKGGKET